MHNLQRYEAFRENIVFFHENKVAIERALKAGDTLAAELIAWNLIAVTRGNETALDEFNSACHQWRKREEENAAQMSTIAS